jgi:hypothetical protein
VSQNAVLILNTAVIEIDPVADSCAVQTIIKFAATVHCGPSRNLRGPSAAGLSGRARGRREAPETSVAVYMRIGPAAYIGA